MLQRGRRQSRSLTELQSPPLPPVLPPLPPVSLPPPFPLAYASLITSLFLLGAMRSICHARALGQSLQPSSLRSRWSSIPSFHMPYCPHPRPHWEQGPGSKPASPPGTVFWGGDLGCLGDMIAHLPLAFLPAGRVAATAERESGRWTDTQRQN